MAFSTGHLNPHSRIEHTESRAYRTAFRIFHEAAKRVPAYKDFLKKNGVSARFIKTKNDFAKLPLTDKQSYFSKYSLAELSWDGSLDASSGISTSSGSTGRPFFWPRGDQQETIAGAIFSNIYEHIFSAIHGRILVIDSFALGTWIAGFEFYNATRFARKRMNRLTLATPGIERVEAINQIKCLSRGFDRVILSGYPPFVKDIIEFGAAEGIDWLKLDVSLFVGGEAVSEQWRAKVLKRIGKKDDGYSFVNVYGMAETGIVAHDTPFTTKLRRSIEDIVPTDRSQGLSVTGVYQYYPTLRYFESGADHSLILTSNAALPLVRYDTRDTGGILDRTVMNTHVRMREWQLPCVYLYGRKDLSVSLYALNIYVENVKYALERSRSGHLFSGLFIMDVLYDTNLDQRFEITIELARNVRINSTIMASKVMTEVVSTLCRVNSEYSKLLSAVGERAHPRITFVPYGKLDTIPGRKHKWVVRETLQTL